MTNKEQRPSYRPGGFTFKQFFVAHDKCGMKVTTDGIVLGSWAAINEQCHRVLDIGTGSGLLVLMLAQRSASSTKLDAVDIDESAVSQARENVLASPWSSRIQIFHTDISTFVAQQAGGYDAIVCNPPYYPQGCECRDAPREKARYATGLRHADLLAYAKRLLKPEGAFSLMLTTAPAEALLVQAAQDGWFIRRRTHVSDRVGRAPYLTLLELTRAPCSGDEQYLFIREEDGGNYTKAYRALTKDFYLFF
ncbi:tRNA1(Val) (adenine(37)-N6)-methyltransferase [Leminorella richardii]|uniref:tRNA1(Val) (adenine(37)-N6)-methyltransferase n=1 Tax=Leminorella richardii TaxID=158841 RepID=A0A2X4UU20_9GAMM|nr:methyltransferase [Leminorella richardii]SQI41949.1 tRNA1(Val) (adenine(37)-N6)-methyltransferase [Leminorella richardii]